MARRDRVAQSIALTFRRQKSRKLLSQYPAILTKLPNVAFRSFNFRTGMNQCQDWHMANAQSTDCRSKIFLLLILLFFFYEAGIQNSSRHTKQMFYCLCPFYVLFLFYRVEQSRVRAEERRWKSKKSKKKQRGQEDEKRRRKESKEVRDPVRKLF